MRQRRVAGMMRIVMAGALVLTALPLLAPWWPTGPLAAVPVIAGAVSSDPGFLVLDLKDNLSPAELHSFNQQYALQSKLVSPHAADDGLMTAQVPVGQEAALLERLRKDPRVEAADLQHRYSVPPASSLAAPNQDAGSVSAGSAAPAPGTRTDGAPNDPLWEKQWNMRMVGAQNAWKRTTGQGIVVAVIDTGVNFEDDDHCHRHKDLSGTKFAPGYDFVNQDDHPNDDHGHGTHVSGTIAETTNNGEGAVGLAPGAVIMPLKVLDEYGSGTSAAIADAVRFAADNGAKVINMSLGGSSPDAVMRRACEYAHKKDVLIICAAGNSGGGPVGYPAGFPECVAVSSVGPGGELAPYSSIGKQVAIAAPGGDQSQGYDAGIVQNVSAFTESGTWDDRYVAVQGTSMASPHVAAAAALIMSRGVKDAEQVKQLLQRSAAPKKPSEKYGAGVLNAAKGVDFADAASRDSVLKLLFTVFAVLTGLGVGAVRDRVKGLARYPSVAFGLALGALGPDLIFGWLGYGSPFSLVFHSALIPLYLLWEAESRAVYRFVSALSLGTAAHLAWEAAWRTPPFAGVMPDHALPWMWVNVAVGVGVAVVAWRRSLSAS